MKSTLVMLLATIAVAATLGPSALQALQRPSGTAPGATPASSTSQTTPLPPRSHAREDDDDD